MFEIAALKGGAEYFNVSLDDRSPKCCFDADADADGTAAAAAADDDDDDDDDTDGFNDEIVWEALYSSVTSCCGRRLPIDSTSSSELRTEGKLLVRNKRGLEFEFQTTTA